MIRVARLDGFCCPASWAAGLTIGHRQALLIPSIALALIDLCIGGLLPIRPR